MRNWRFLGVFCLASAGFAVAAAVDLAPSLQSAGLHPLKVIVLVLVAFLAGFVLRDGLEWKSPPSIVNVQQKALWLSLAGSRLRDASAAVVNDLVGRTVATPELVIRVKLARQAEAGFDRSLESLTRELTPDTLPEGLHIVSEATLRPDISSIG